MIFLEYWEWIYGISVILLYFIASIIIIQTLLKNKLPEVTLAWVLILILFPLVGIILFSFFGQHYTKKRKLKRLKIKEFKRIGTLSKRQFNTFHAEPDSTKDIVKKNLKVIQLLLKDNKAFLSANNDIKIFHFGIDTYTSLFEDLKNALHHIHIQFYIFEEGEIVNRIKDIIIEKRNAGVKVTIIVDGIGSRDLSDAFFAEMEGAGVEILIFRPVRFSRFNRDINYRNHRKIVVIDGKIGYTGGMNIADKYINGNQYGHWQDAHIRIEGDAVKSLQTIFLVDRYYITNSFFDRLSDYFPQFEHSGQTYVQIASSEPDSWQDNILYMYFLAISNATKRLMVVTPYFSPTESLLTALKSAASAGVDVRIVLPLKGDSVLVQYSAYSYIEQLLYSGVKVYLNKNGFNHSKIILADDSFTSIGSANVDYRSFYMNFEVNAVLYDEKINNSLYNMYSEYIKNCDEIQLKNWLKRPLKQKIFESLARLTAPLI